MAKLPYFPFYPADWLSSPTVMCATLEQQGAYLRILCACWLSPDCAVADNPQTLSQLSGLPEHLLPFLHSVMMQHPTKTGYLTNARLLSEFEKAERVVSYKSQAGVISGKSRRTGVRTDSTNRSRTGVRNQNQNQSHIQNQRSESESEPKKKKIKSCKSPSALAPGETVEVWNAYEHAYEQRYGIKPVRNGRTNGMLADLLKRLPKSEAPQVAAFYLTHNNPYYVAKRHPVNLLLADAEGLRTQWATGTKATTLESRQAEVKDSVLEQVKRVEAILKGRATA